MAAFLHFLTQGVEREDDAAAVIRLVEISGLLLNRQFAQRVFDQFLCVARIEIALLPV